ncbi:tRNA (adenosine(37)-N6)-dimethylallyltransferase MiaA [Candidatus Uhrbacteria bacterium]|nr:tRNA (adenosine(37)-N6)-dimethylallyltransferase MiaA [Candidatus Uhrbacteria bacterium]
MPNPKIITLVGPTASGKTAIGIALAKRFNSEVICVDSRTVFRDMDIGTAKPEGEWTEESIETSGSIRQLFGSRRCLMVEGVPHWGIDLADPDEDYNVSHFKPYAEERIRNIAGRGKLPILVGGTGLWIDVLVDNLDLPEVKPDPKLRAELEARHVDDLFAEYKRLDPDGALVIDGHNPRRLVRAIEVCRLTGRPFSELRRKGDSRYDCLWIGLDVPQGELHRRIEARVDRMIALGLVDEVRRLRSRYGYGAPSMSGIGYRQVCAFLEGKRDLAEAIEDVKRDTRQYAKRQMTWFKRRSDIRWVSDEAGAVAVVKGFFAGKQTENRPGG